MLLSFKVKNWQCFRDEVELSLRASKERRHAETLTKLPKMYGTTKVLPMAAVYGQNGAGKTALFEALCFLQSLVVAGTEIDEQIPATPFLLNSRSPQEPTELTIEFVIEDRVYKYWVLLDAEHILGESLAKIRTRDNETLFERGGQLPVKLGKAIANPRLELIAENTRENQLFLHNAVEQNSDELRPFYNWFRYSLQTISIGGRYGNYSKMLVDEGFNDFASEYLQRYNTGACRLVSKQVEDEDLAATLRKYATRKLPQNSENFTGGVQVSAQSDNSNSQLFFVKFQDGQFQSVEKLSLEHVGEGGYTETLDLAEESTGTQRFVELLPAYYDLLAVPDNDKGSTVTYVIDEIDRSAHSFMISDLLRQFIEGYSPARKRQLIFTAHDLSLMNEDFMRKDEVWILTKERESGRSHLECVARHEGTRSDNNITKQYRKGEYGGKPA